MKGKLHLRCLHVCVGGGGGGSSENQKQFAYYAEIEKKILELELKLVNGSHQQTQNQDLDRKLTGFWWF